MKDSDFIGDAQESIFGSAERNENSFDGDTTVPDGGMKVAEGGGDTPFSDLSNQAAMTVENTFEITDDRAMEAGETLFKLGEKGLLDVDQESGTLESIRSQFASGDTAFSEDERGVIEDVVSTASGELGAAQRPPGLDVLEDDLDANQRRSVESSGDDGDIIQIDLGRQDTAQEVRERLPTSAKTGKFDGRYKTVEVDTSELSEQQLTRIIGDQADTTAFEDQKTGNVELTESEKDRIDFTETTVVEARAAKADFLDRGVDDWVSFFDETLTVNENEQLAEKAAKEDSGDMASETTARERMADAYRRSEEEIEEFALKGAREGNQEAIETLKEINGGDLDGYDLPQIMKDRAKGHNVSEDAELPDNFVDNPDGGQESLGSAESETDETDESETDETDEFPDFVDTTPVKESAFPGGIISAEGLRDSMPETFVDKRSSPEDRDLTEIAEREQFLDEFVDRRGGEQEELIRLKSSGRFNKEPVVQAPDSPGQRSLANGEYVGDESNISRPADPQAEIKRKENGEFFIP